MADIPAPLQATTRITRATLDDWLAEWESIGGGTWAEFSEWMNLNIGQDTGATPRARENMGASQTRHRGRVLTTA